MRAGLLIAATVTCTRPTRIAFHSPGAVPLIHRPETCISNACGGPEVKLLVDRTCTTVTRLKTYEQKS